MSGHDVTLLLQSLQRGTGAPARARLLEAVYDELRAMAGARMRRERPGHTLQPTALVNEAYLRLVKTDPGWQSRAHFFSAAGEAMRRILIDHARRHGAGKRAGAGERVTLADLAVESDETPLDLLRLDQALDALERADARLAEVVRLRYFAGLSIEQTAALLEVSPATVKRDWTYARAWLVERMEPGAREA